jgi:hypothetical protein
MLERRSGEGSISRFDLLAGRGGRSAKDSRDHKTYLLIDSKDSLGGVAERIQVVMAESELRASN